METSAVEQNSSKQGGLPVEVFDSHFHIIDPKFPLIPNQGYLPDAFTCDDYLRSALPAKVIGGAVVSGSFQAFDQTYLVDALAKLGPSYVGVTQLPAAVSDETLVRLHEKGIRALRFNIKRGGTEQISLLKSMADRVHALLGWHIELYIDAADIEPLLGLLVTLPRVSIDHLGLTVAGLDNLKRLADKGVGIKATGFGRVDFEVAPVIEDICRINPDVLMFGTDLPSTRAKRPYQHEDLLLLKRVLPEQLVAKVLRENAMNFYRINHS